MESRALEQSASLVGVIQWHVERSPDTEVFSFLGDGQSVSQAFTYRELHRCARTVAAALAERGVRPGDRVVLFYPPESCAEFVKALWGCLYAGAIAVPTYPPDPRRIARSLPPFLAIVGDAECGHVLAPASVIKMAELMLTQAPALQDMTWIASDELTTGEELWVRPDVSSETVAFLQYTSGSTGRPKGVMVTHGNLMHNLMDYADELRTPDGTVIVGWLPFFHDMGLINQVFAPFAFGVRSYVMAPLTFLSQPRLWLEAVTRYRGTFSAAPGFAYDLCVRRLGDDVKQNLDLACWHRVVVAAEPIRPTTMDGFSKAFASTGFKREAFCPSYGLAENTLLVSGGPIAPERQLLRVDAKALENRIVELRETAQSGASTLEHDLRRIVSAGPVRAGHTVRIVNPDTRTQCAGNEIGEIWVSSPSNAKGYWKNKEATEETFRAFINGSDEGPFLRTGDLGFIRDEQLFITGRIKDLIILRGRNYSPHDIEYCTDSAHEVLRPGCCAAFSVVGDEGEELVVVCEAKPGFERSVYDDAMQAIVTRVSEELQIEISAVVLINARTIHKTTSGKIQRRACRASYLESGFEILAERRRGSSGVTDNAPVPARPLPRSAEDVELWLYERLKTQFDIPESVLGPNEELSNYGLSSIDATTLVEALGDWIGCRFAPTVAWDYPTVRAVAGHVYERSKELADPATGGAPGETKSKKSKADQLLEEIEGDPSLDAGSTEDA